MASYNIHDTVARPAWCVGGVGRLAQGSDAVCFHQFFFYFLDPVTSKGILYLGISNKIYL